jgi:hypothetical protein
MAMKTRKTGGDSANEGVQKGQDIPSMLQKLPSQARVVCCWREDKNTRFFLLWIRTSQNGNLDARSFSSHPLHFIHPHHQKNVHIAVAIIIPLLLLQTLHKMKKYFLDAALRHESHTKCHFV